MSAGKVHSAPCMAIGISGFRSGPLCLSMQHAIRQGAAKAPDMRQKRFISAKARSICNKRLQSLRIMGIDCFPHFPGKAMALIVLLINRSGERMIPVRNGPGGLDRNRPTGSVRTHPLSMLLACAIRSASTR